MEKKTNPRSTGEISHEYYSKHSEEVSYEGEAIELKRCEAKSIRTEHIVTSRLISFDKENNILTTERINGSELFLALWNSTSLLAKLRGKDQHNLDILVSRLSETGTWLSTYHKTSPESDECEQAVKWLYNSFLSKTKGIRDNNLLSAKLIARIEKRFLHEIENLTKVDYLKNNQIKICRTHGDFIIYNMLIDKDNNINIIDFGDTRIAGNLDDVARFYGNIWAISQTNTQRKSLLLPVLDEFLTNYGLTKDILDLPYFQTMMAYNFLIHLYGAHCMRDSLSFFSRLELKQITDAGLRWIYQKI